MLNSVRLSKLGFATSLQDEETGVPESDDLARQVYGLLGLPVDAILFSNLLRKIALAAEQSSPLLVSTPNVNFLVKSQSNAAFRESILTSDLCLIDGMPLIWIAKLLAIPVKERVAGSDMFGRLKSKSPGARPLRVFLFGGTGDLAARVGAKLNAENCGLECVGALNPGFGSIEELSSPEILEAINSSGADLLAVFFSAEKAQAWLLRNHSCLRPPIRAQFGATINFEAGTVRRAPACLRSTGFEWLWRIKEEPYLWKRYASDGLNLARLFVSSVLPLWLANALVRQDGRPSCTILEGHNAVTLALDGAATGANIEPLTAQVRAALQLGKPLCIDLSLTKAIDSRCFGLFLMVRKILRERGHRLSFTNVSAQMRRLFRLNRFEYLLTAE